MLPTLIIGTGPAGLAVAGRLRHNGLPFEIIEQSDQVGIAWRRHYDRLHLHTVKQWSHLPHLPFPEDYPTYASRQQVVDYLDSYAKQFDIQPKFGQEVKSIRKLADGTWQVVAKETFQAKNVVIATGTNRIPNVPTWEGQDRFEGTIIHSRNYKNPQPFFNQKVLVIGMGNTGAEVALDLANHGVDTYISVRSPVSVVPRDLNGRPVQVTSKQLAKLPFGFGDWLGSVIRKIYFGNLAKYGLDTHPMHPAQLLRETGQTPIVDIGTMAAIKEGKIKVVKDISHFDTTAVHFKNGQIEDFDAVILATGYRAKIEDFLENSDSLLDANRLPKQVVGTGDHQGLFFVGFDNYKLGGLLGTIFTDSEVVMTKVKET